MPDPEQAAGMSILLTMQMACRIGTPFREAGCGPAIPSPVRPVAPDNISALLWERGNPNPPRILHKAPLRGYRAVDIRSRIHWNTILRRMLVQGGRHNDRPNATSQIQATHDVQQWQALRPGARPLCSTGYGRGPSWFDCAGRRAAATAPIRAVHRQRLHLSSGRDDAAHTTPQLCLSHLRVHLRSTEDPADSRSCTFGDSTA